jgi:hypothetical protein
VRVINAGVNGFGSDQILARTARDPAPFDPNLIAAAIIGDNGFGDLLGNKLLHLDEPGTRRFHGCSNHSTRKSVEPGHRPEAEGADGRLEST